MVKIGKCKARARESLLGRYTLVIGAQILAYLIPAALLMLAGAAFGAALYGGGIIGSTGTSNILITTVGALCFSAFLITGIVMGIFLGYGVTRLYINICRGRGCGISDIFYPFTDGAHPWRVLGVKILQWIILAVSVIIEGAFISLNRVFAGLDGFGALSVGFAVLAVIAGIVYLYVITGFYLCDLVIIDTPEEGVFGAFERSARLMKGLRLKAIWLMFFSFIFWRILLCACQLAALWVVPYMICTRIFFYIFADARSAEIEPADYTEVRDDSGPSGGTSSAEGYAPTITDEIIKAAEYRTDAPSDMEPEASDFDGGSAAADKGTGDDTAPSPQAPDDGEAELADTDAAAAANEPAEADMVPEPSDDEKSDKTD